MSAHVWILGQKTNYRGENLERQLKFYNILYSNFWTHSEDKTYLKQLSIKELNFQTFQYGRQLLENEISCSLGHIGIYETFLRTNYDWALILEDDAVVNLGLNVFLDNLKQHTEPVVIHLDSSVPGSYVNETSSFFSKFGISGFKIKKLLELPPGAYGYVINHRAVELMNFAASKRLLSVADFPYLWPPPFKYYVVDSALVCTDDAPPSLIGERIPSLEKPPYFRPSVKRTLSAINFGVPYQLSLYREFFIKLLRIYLRLKHEVKFWQR